MERLKQRLEETLRMQFPGSDIALETHRRAARISGIIAWDGFQGLEPIDRASRLWSVLREGFSREDQLRLSAIIPLSPAEYAVYKHEQAAGHETLAA